MSKNDNNEIVAAVLTHAGITSGKAPNLIVQMYRNVLETLNRNKPARKSD